MPSSLVDAVVRYNRFKKRQRPTFTFHHSPCGPQLPHPPHLRQLRLGRGQILLLVDRMDPRTMAAERRRIDLDKVLCLQRCRVSIAMAMEARILLLRRLGIIRILFGSQASFSTWAARGMHCTSWRHTKSEYVYISFPLLTVLLELCCSLRV